MASPPSPRRGSRSPQPPSRPQSSEFISTTQGLLQDLQLSESFFPTSLDAAHRPAGAPPAGHPAAPDQSVFHYPYAVPAEFSPPASAFLHQPHHQPYPQDYFQQRPPSVVVTPAAAATSLHPAASASETADMSAVTAPHFDPAFGFGSRASSGFWSDNGLLDQSFSSYASDAQLPPSTPVPRSGVASPQQPHASIALTVPQRELKRQRDLVRREAKAASRRQSATPGASPSSINLDLPTFSPDLNAAAAAAAAVAADYRRPSTATSAVSSAVSSAAASPAFAPAVTTVSPSSLVAIPPVTSAGAGAAAAAAASPASSPFLPPTTMADLGDAASSAGGGPPGLYATSAAALAHGHPTSYMTAGGGAGSGGGAYSPPMHVHQDALFSAGYQGQAYMPQYTTSPFGSPPMQQQYPRGPIPDQQALLYQMPPPQPPLLHHQAAHHLPPPPGHLHHQSSAPMSSPPLPGAPMHHGPVPQPMYGYGGGSDNGGEGSSLGVGVGVGVGGVAGGVSGGVRAVSGGRPKPQCWEHGCNGREFSTSSNLLRHQREKSGQAAKAKCPNCGAEFTRTTARNGHMQHEKCKQRHR